MNGSDKTKRTLVWAFFIFVCLLLVTLFGTCRNVSMKMRHFLQQFSVAPDRYLVAPVC